MNFPNQKNSNIKLVKFLKLEPELKAEATHGETWRSSATLLIPITLAAQEPYRYRYRYPFIHAKMLKECACRVELTGQIYEIKPSQRWLKFNQPEGDPPPPSSDKK